MSLFFRPAEQRDVSLQEAFVNGYDLPIGSASPTRAAERLIPLYAAHRTIIDAVAATPLHAYAMTATGVPQRVADDPPVLSAPPIGTVFTWKAQYAASLLSDGNAFGLVLSVDSAGWPTSVYWLNPYDVTIDETGAIPAYSYGGRTLDSRSLLHIPWIVPAGRFRGISPLRAFKTAIEMGVSAQQVGRDWFVGGAIPSGHLKNNRGTLTPTIVDETKSRFKAAVKGRDVFVSGADWDYTTIGVPADEARFIETLRLSATQIATIYGIPPEEIGGEVGGSSLTYATQEMNDIKFNRRVVQPWAVRLEEALSAAMPRGVYAKFNLDANVRSDLKSRMEAHEIGLRAGVIAQDEARRLEDRPPFTPEQQADWLLSWRGLDMAEFIRKIYLGVGKVVTVEDARAIVSRLGGIDLPPRTADEVFAQIPPMPASPDQPNQDGAPQ